MSKSSTKPTRFDFRLRREIPIESKLLSEMEAKTVYGDKGKLLRECLRRGFTILGDAVDQQSPAASEEQILDALARRFSGDEYDYRVGKLFLDARAAIKAGSQQSADVAPSAVIPAAKPVDPVPSPSFQPPAAAPEQVEQQTAPVEPGPVAADNDSANAEPPVESVPAADEERKPKAHDWSSLRRIAGSDKG